MGAGAGGAAGPGCYCSNQVGRETQDRVRDASRTDASSGGWDRVRGPSCWTDGVVAPWLVDMQQLQPLKE